MSVKIAGLSHRLAADTKGGVAIVTAFAIPVILGFSALALEYGTALQTKSKNQRTSDIAAFAAAHAYKRDASANTADKEKAARTAAASIATLNGVSSGVSVSFDDPADAKTIDVTISEDKPIYLSRLLRPDDSVTINTLSRVALGQGGDFKACIVALDPDPDGGSGLRINGIPAGNYDMTGCGIGSNAPIRVNGNGVIGTKCAAPEFDPGANNPGACNEDTIESGFTDPLSGITSWPTDTSDDAVCDYIGEFPDDFLADSNGSNGNGNGNGNGGGGQTGNTLKPGVLCVTGMANGNFGTVESDGNEYDEDAIGNTLVIKSGVDFEMKGNESLSIKPPETGDFAGVAIYAPGSNIKLAGTPDFSRHSLGCLGLVAGSWTLSGNVTMNVKAKCEDGDPYFDEAGTGTGGRPMLIQ